MNVFLGLNASAEELGVKRQNCWAFTTNNIDQDGLEYFNMDADQVTVRCRANNINISIPILLKESKSYFSAGS